VLLKPLQRSRTRFENVSNSNISCVLRLFCHTRRQLFLGYNRLYLRGLCKTKMTRRNRNSQCQPQTQQCRVKNLSPFENPFPNEIRCNQHSCSKKQGTSGTSRLTKSIETIFQDQIESRRSLISTVLQIPILFYPPMRHIKYIYLIFFFG
jgi:hypothetical protein